VQPGLDSRVIVIGATNRPADLDDAVCRRLSRRIYVPLPDHVTRRKLLQITLDPEICVLSDDELDEIASATEGYSGSDLTSLCKEAAMRPVRELSSDQLAVVDVQSLRTLTSVDVLASMSVVKPSVQASVLKSFEAWNSEFGSDMTSL
jgi:SpoVK/Ycf46/Vps4 family AAA+-type ATPase